MSLLLLFNSGTPPPAGGFSSWVALWPYGLGKPVGQTVAPDAGALTITGYAPTVAQSDNQSVAPGAGALTFTGYAPSISQPIGVLPDVGALTISGHAPTIAQPQAVDPAAGALTFTGYAPTVTQAAGAVGFASWVGLWPYGFGKTASQAADPPAGTLTITGYAPMVERTSSGDGLAAWGRAGNRLGRGPLSRGKFYISKPVEGFHVAENTAVTPDAGTLTFAGYAPTIAQTANQALDPAAGALTLTGYAPTIAQPQGIAPDVGPLTITGHAPTITQAVNQAINPDAGTLAITGHVPTVAQSVTQEVNPDTGSIAITGYAPTLAQSDNLAVAPEAGLLTFTGYAPTVQQASASPNLEPEAGVLTITGYAPTVTVGGIGGHGFEMGNEAEKKPRRRNIVYVEIPDSSPADAPKKTRQPVAFEDARNKAYAIIEAAAQKHIDSAAVSQAGRYASVRSALKPLERDLRGWNWITVYQRIYDQMMTEAIRAELAALDETEENDLIALLLMT